MTARRFRGFFRNFSGPTGLVLITLVVLAAVLAPYLTPYDPLQQNLANRLQSPGGEHLLGTDQLGRDVLTRLLYGARISLATGIVSVIIGVTLGVVVGVSAGFFGGRLDAFLMAVNDILLGFRTFFLAILVVAILGTSMSNLMLAIGLGMFPQFARIIRSEVLSVRAREYVEAARALGARDLALMARHVLPNVFGPIVVMASFYVATAIVIESSLSFLGLGAPPPTPSWGMMISEGRRFILDDAWLPTIPGVAIMLTVLSFNLIGDTLRDVFDPRFR